MFSFSKGISQKLCLETHCFYATSLFLYVVGSEYEYGRISPAEQTKQTLTQRPLWYRWFFACKDSSVINGLYVVVGTVLYRVDIVHVKDLSGSTEANKHPYRAQREQRTCTPNINCFHSAIRQNYLHGLVHGPPHSAVVERLLPRLPPLPDFGVSVLPSNFLKPSESHDHCPFSHRRQQASDGYREQDMNMNMPWCIASWPFSATSATYLEVSRQVRLQNSSDFLVRERCSVLPERCPNGTRKLKEKQSRTFHMFGLKPTQSCLSSSAVWTFE